MAQGAPEVLPCHRRGSCLLSDLFLRLRPSALAALEFPGDPDPLVVQAGIPQCRSCGLAVQGAREAQGGLGVHPVRLVLAMIHLETPGHLSLLSHQGSQEHQPVLELGSLEGLAGLAILGNLWGLALLSTLGHPGTHALLSLPRVQGRWQCQVGLEDLLHLCLP